MSGPVFSVQEIIEATGAQTRGDVADVAGVCTDSRSVRPGELFVALKGDNFDGHAFVRGALESGAAGALVELGFKDADLPESAPLFLVPDSLVAYGDLASFHRKRSKAMVFALTGSSGKTTTKEILASLLETKYETLKTEKNFNNLIGVPQTLLRLSGERFAVVECGMNAEGELARLTEIVHPDVGIVLNVAEAHLEGLKNIEGVARAKGELFEGLAPDAVAVANLDDSRVMDQSYRAPCRKITFSLNNPEAHVLATHVEPENVSTNLEFLAGLKVYRTELPLPGNHNVSNALAAFGAVIAAGLDLDELLPGLASVSVPGSRMKIVELPNDIHVIDDTYNANPASMAAALGYLSSAAGDARKLAVLGDMKELGEHAARLHERLGNQTAAYRVDHLFTYGTHAEDVARGAMSAGLAGENVHVFTKLEDLTDELAALAAPEDWILVKGSRSMKMERVVEALERANAERGD